MKRYILPFALILLIALSCTQPPKESNKANVMDWVPVDTSTAKFEVSALSAEELRDDSVFSDGSIPSSWKNAGITNIKGMKLFVKKLQQWIVLNDKDSLASALKYPLGKTIKTKLDAVAKYDSLFTKEVKLSFATLNFNQLFRNQNGVMTSGGKVWFAQEGKGFKITAINP